jgi:uncharacterized protein (TIGR00251 family)
MSLLVTLKVIPSSGRSGFTLDASGKLKVYLKSPPEDGKANKELIQLLAKALGCTQDLITIVSGATSRTKKIKIDVPLTYDDVISRLGFALQTKFLS